jgi:hypothetical protein
MAVANNITPENEIWYGATTYGQAKKAMWGPIKRAIPRSWVAKINESELSIYLKSGHVVRLVGLDRYDTLRGAGLYFFVGDEWADSKKEAWDETISPMLSTTEGHALFIGTPKSFNHFYDFYTKGLPNAIDQNGNPIEDHKSFMFTTYQGGNVSEKEFNRAKASLDSRTFAQEFLASFENFTGRVISSFVRSESIKPCKDKYTNTSQISLGIDFNVNPMSCTAWITEGDIDYQFAEIVMQDSDTDKLVIEIRNRFARNGQLSHITAYPDASGKSRRTSANGRTDHTILQQAGINVRPLSNNPSVRDRFNVTNARFCSADGVRHAFIDPSCTKSIESYEKLIYRDGSSEPDKKSGFDHIVDATGYFMYTKYFNKPVQQKFINIMGR